MTKETHLVFELSDLKNLRITCRNCKGSILCPISDEKRAHANECPHCGGEIGLARTENAAAKFVEAMRMILAKDDGLKVDLKFEIEIEDPTE